MNYICDVKANAHGLQESNGNPFVAFFYYHFHQWTAPAYLVPDRSLVGRNIRIIKKKEPAMMERRVDKCPR